MAKDRQSGGGAHDGWPKALGLSRPQRDLLAELRAGDGLFIHAHRRYARTIRALETKGLVRCDAPDYSRMAQDHWVAVREEGWWLCPNEPRCSHGDVLHDRYDYDDPSPTCCADGCACGRAPATEAPR